MKKKHLIWLALLSVAVLLIGCGETGKLQSADEVVKKSEEKIAKVKDVERDMKINIDLVMLLLGQSVDMKVMGDLKETYSASPDIVHLEGTMDITSAGNEEKQEIKSYTVQEAGKTVSYEMEQPADGSAAQWVKKETNVDTSIQSVLKSDFDLYHKYPAKFQLEQPSEQINGKDVYLLKANVDEEMLADAVRVAFSQDGESGDSSVQDLLTAMNMKELNMVVEIAIDQKELLPAKFAIRMTEQKEVSLNLSELLGEDSTGIESTAASARFHQLSSEYNYHSFNTGTVVTIPDDVKNSAVQQ